MAEQIPRKDELQERAADGLPVTTSEVSNLAQAESELTGRGPIKGGVAATAQSVKDRQQNYIETAGDVARKPAEDISKADAAAVQSAEVCRYTIAISISAGRIWLDECLNFFFPLRKS